MASIPRQVPTLLRTHAKIDDILAEHIGPYARELCSGLMAEFENKHQDGPAAVHRYIARLAQFITGESERRAFINDAHRRSGLFG